MAARTKTGTYKPRHASRETASAPDVEYLGRHRAEQVPPPSEGGR